MSHGVTKLSDPGAVKFADGEITINANSPAEVIIMENTGDRPIQIGSHHHLYEVNKAIKFYSEDKVEDPERLIVWGKRFDIPSSTSVRFEPNEKKPVNVIKMTGNGQVYGLNNLADGELKNGPKVPYSEAVKKIN